MKSILPKHPYISSVEAAKRFDITHDYVGALCRQGKVRGQIVGRLWFVDEKSLSTYLARMQTKREAQKEMLRKTMRHVWAAMLLVACIAAPHARASSGPISISDTLAYLPDAMIDTTYQGELAIGQAYWNAVNEYVQATYVARDVAAAIVATIADPQPPQVAATPTAAPVPTASGMSLAQVLNAASVALAPSDLRPTYALPTIAPSSASESENLDWLAYFPDTLSDTTYGVAVAINNSYWDLLDGYVSTSQAAIDSASNVYIGSIQAFVNSTYATRDLSAAAYGGIATTWMSVLDSVHESQVHSIEYMGASMADGASDMSAAYQALGDWYGRDTVRIQQRLAQPTRAPLSSDHATAEAAPIIVHQTMQQAPPTPAESSVSVAQPATVSIGIDDVRVYTRASSAAEVG